VISQVWHNAYVAFIWGIVVDHLHFCSAYYPSVKRCVTLFFVQDWVDKLAMAAGGTKCQLGMFIVAAYLHSGRGRRLTSYDASLFFIYMAFRWVYPFPFWYVMPQGRHSYSRSSSHKNSRVLFFRAR
jgi:hypothetical protein